MSGGLAKAHIQEEVMLAFNAPPGTSNVSANLNAFIRNFRPTGLASGVRGAGGGSVGDPLLLRHILI